MTTDMCESIFVCVLRETSEDQQHPDLVHGAVRPVPVQVLPEPEPPAAVLRAGPQVGLM